MKFNNDEKGNLTDSKIRELLTTTDKELVFGLQKEAERVAKEQFGNKIYIRGLIEISNYCKEGCYYCGINIHNKALTRFRLSKEEILQSVHVGYREGFRTFVLQGGEDSYFSDDRLSDIIRQIKKEYPDVAVTLSLGIRSKNSYQRLKQSGADRYLLRHESADSEIFNSLHPKNQSLKMRIEAIQNLKELGYQTGTGFMIGAPGSSVESYIKDIHLIRELKPEMVGIGPFIPHEKTIFNDKSAGSVDMTLRLISILRIENPKALIPSTTALNTVHPKGRILGVLAGANVIMPNLSPDFAKKNYTLYNNKKIDGLEAGKHIKELDILLHEYGYEIEITRGDFKK